MKSSREPNFIRTWSADSWPDRRDWRLRRVLIKITDLGYQSSIKVELTPQAQLSIQWTIRILTREKVLLTKSDREGRENVCAPFYQLSCDEN